MAKPASKRKPEPARSDAPEFFYDLPQRGQDWDDLRRGIPTSSRLNIVKAEGKDGGDSVTRAKLMRILAGEIITGRTNSFTFRNEDMERGVNDEPLARDWYSRTQFVDLKPVGFVRRRLPSGRFVGCSPDDQIEGQSAGIEIKSLRPDLWIEAFEKGAAGFPSGHRAQCQGTLWICEWEWIDLILFSEGFPSNLRFRVVRDEPYIRELSNAVEIFDFELNRLVEKIKAGAR